MPEMKSSIGKLKTNKASPDNIHNETIYLLYVLLDIINESWEKGVVPSDWLQGLIIPIHKNGKCKKKLDSYRPVTLMSVIAKLMERMVCARLRYELESRGLLDDVQSGFRKGRSTMDPLLDLVSDIQESFEAKGVTMLSTVDLSRAFDKVNPNLLLDEFRVMGIPPCFAKWYLAFLMDRRYRVKWGTKMCGSCRFANGVPQGSVSGPLLFIIFMNSLSKRVSALKEPRLRFRCFADDSSLWCSSSKKDSAEIETGVIVQKGLDVISTWSKEYGMPISAGKNEVVLFTLRAKVILPMMHIGDDNIAFKDSVKILGVIFDKKLSFAEHFEKVQTSTKVRLNQISKVAGPTFGQGASDLRAFYIAYVRSGMEYCGPVWSPFLCDSRVHKLEVLQNRAMRTITGCVVGTKTERLLCEANLLPIKVQHEIQAALAAEKCRRMSGESALRQTASRAVRLKRLVKTGTSWMDKSDSILAKRGLCAPRTMSNMAKLDTRQYSSDEYMRGFGTNIDPRNREELMTNTLFCPALVVDYEHVMRFNTTTIIKCSKTSSVEEKLRANNATREGLGDFDWEIWTDGTVQDKLGAGAALIFKKHVSEAVNSVIAPSGYLSASFRAEMVALSAGLETFIKAETIGESLLIGTDSQSSVSKLKAGPLDQDSRLSQDVWKKLDTLLMRGWVITMQFFYSHCGTKRNDEVDALADLALTACVERQHLAPIPYCAVKAEVKRGCREEWRSSLAPMSKPVDLKLMKTELTRKEYVTSARLRTGQCPEVGRMHWKFLKLTPNCQCRCCGLGEETVEHLFDDCLASVVVTLKSKYAIKDRDALYKDPKKAVGFYSELSEYMGWCDASK
jgi:ribonuclease HI